MFLLNNSPKDVIHTDRRRKREQRTIFQRRACFKHVDPKNQANSEIGLCIKNRGDTLTSLPLLPCQIEYIDNNRWVRFKGLVDTGGREKVVEVRVMFYDVIEHIEIHTPDFYKNKVIPDITRLITRII